MALHFSGFLNNLGRKEKGWEESVNKDNRCEDLLKWRNDRGEFYAKKTDVRHQKAELKEVKRTRCEERCEQEGSLKEIRERERERERAQGGRRSDGGMKSVLGEGVFMLECR